MFGKGQPSEMGRIQKMYTIYDRVAEEAAPIFVAPNHGVAVRKFRQLMSTVIPGSETDYRLVYLGEFNLRDMSLKIEVNPVDVPVPFEAKAEKDAE